MLKIFFLKANVEIDDEEFESALSSGKINKYLMSDVAQTEELASLQKRTDDMQRILTNIKEANQLQLLLNNMINKQQVLFDKIELDHQQISHKVKQGKESLESALWYRQRRYQIILGVSALVIVIVVILCVSFCT